MILLFVQLLEDRGPGIIAKDRLAIDDRGISPGAT
jgi:hypothetical protein